MKLIHRAAALAAPLALALGALGPTAHAAPTAPAAPIDDPASLINPRTDCPPDYPPGSQYPICLILLVGGGSMKLGGLTQQIDQPIKIVVQNLITADGDLKDTYTAMSGEPMTIPGGVLGVLGLPDVPFLSSLPLFQVKVQAQYAGKFAINLPNVNLKMKIKVENPLLGDTCTIGTDEDPIDMNLNADLGNLTIVKEGDPDRPFDDPSVMRVPAEENTFSVPKTSGCGFLAPIIDWAVGLPSASGQNSAHFDSYLTIAAYPTGDAATDARARKSLTTRFPALTANH
ncbi:hypothetical protein [Actinomadura atramentaria]|uniref:hypothetical protein n=1 Tax=Actinomadura atramentaria TaxID=1990 RepID=UPI0003633C80|nr:hypothetical protein [Actinomadura atramentaria]